MNRPNCTFDVVVAADLRTAKPHSQIIRGKRAITGDTALRLGHWFQTSAQFWLNLQSAYDLRVANDEIGREVAALPTKLTRRRADA